MALDKSKLRVEHEWRSPRWDPNVSHLPPLSVIIGALSVKRCGHPLIGRTWAELESTWRPLALIGDQQRGRVLRSQPGCRFFTNTDYGAGGETRTGVVLCRREQVVVSGSAFTLDAVG